jgi:hypothetical protein
LPHAVGSRALGVLGDEIRDDLGSLGHWQHCPEQAQR